MTKRKYNDIINERSDGKKKRAAIKKERSLKTGQTKKKSIQTNKKSTGIELNKNIERCTNKKIREFDPGSG